MKVKTLNFVYVGFGLHPNKIVAYPNEVGRIIGETAGHWVVEFIFPTGNTFDTGFRKEDVGIEYEFITH